MSQLKTLWRAVEGFSLAAVLACFRGGPGRSRKVIGETLKAAHPDKDIHQLRAWDVVRAFPSEGQIYLEGNRWKDGSTSPLERVILGHILRYFQPKKILEVGTYRGSTTRLILNNTTEASKIWTMDLPPDLSELKSDEATDANLIRNRNVGEEFQEHPRRDSVTQVFGNSQSEETWTSVPEDLNFVFVDASHSYEAVKTDTEFVFGKVSEDGIIAWHDYTEGESAERGVGKYIRELMRERDDIFICEDTELALRIPLKILKDAESRVATFYPDNDYKERFPGGLTPWL